MNRIAQTLKRAVKHHQSGNLREAEKLYRRILRSHPQNAEAHNNLGVALKEQGKHAEAVAQYQQALRWQPDYAEAHNNLANVLMMLGMMDQAVASFRQALSLKHDYVEAHTNLGNALARQHHLDAAIGCYREALRLKSTCWEAWLNLGNVLDCLDKVDEALACYEQAVQIRPDNAEAFNNLGATLMRQAKRDRAIHCYLKALRIKPDYADVFSNLAIALKEQGRLEEASACCQHALRLKPEHVEAQNNLGSVLMEQGRLHESLSCFEQVLSRQPDHVEAHFNRALLWLLQGNWDEGWREYEWRWQAKGFPRPRFNQPLWDGEPLAGRTVLLLGEQGLGDTLQFIRYVPLLKQRGATVIVTCQRPLVPLLQSFPGIDRLVAAGSELPAFDCHASLMSLPGMFQNAPDTVPAKVPYLFANAELLQQWRRELDCIPGFKIGIAWQGSTTFKRDRGRSIPLVHFEPLARLPGVKLFSLQKGFGSEQALALSDRIPMIDFGARLDDAAGPFIDTAAIMKGLDLVITSDTAIAHLAGALGVPVWTMLSVAPDWRWLLDRDDSPWYPTMRLFRQTQLGYWPEVFERIVSELKKRVEPTGKVDSCGSYGRPGQTGFNAGDHFAAVPPAK